ncbi:DUF5060 domain-containing protein [Oceaniferula flava]|uniref:DUF5060 domain-containing protein n=1 Tax=Oceaniferula flava TaxID=2800421 RepID=UPI003CCCAADF
MNVKQSKVPQAVSVGFLLVSAALWARAEVAVSGELKQWHKVTLTVDGPMAKESDQQPNPFTELLLDVRFIHESGSPDYWVPGYFAADGQAADSSATQGTKWRAHLSPDKTGRWNYTVRFNGSKHDGESGSFTIAATDKTGRDFRGKGRLQYVGKRYLRHAGNGQWFLKAGADSPETFLAYQDFDGTVTNNRKKGPLKSWKAHIKDWKSGDPTWKGGKGKGMIGAINYLSGKGANAFSFIPYNAGGDGDNVWPHVSRADKLHFDCSKLDQWGIVFDHATSKGMYLHFKLQETENDDQKGPGKDQALDGGNLGPERKAYLREMVARFGHHLALNWNLGEENTQSLDQIREQAAYLRKIDPYGHLIVLHTYPSQHEKIYGKLVGDKKSLTGVSVQNSDVGKTHQDTLKWVERSEKSGHRWVVAFDEAGNAGAGSPPDPDWPGVAEVRKKNKASKKPLDMPSVNDVRSKVLWGNLMAGGAGVEYYFGYKLPQNDLKAEDWRSRDMTWDYSAIALDFFQENKIPFWEMSNSNALVGNTKKDNSAYCFSKKGEVYVVYLRKANGKQQLDLSETQNAFSLQWFNPRRGGLLQDGKLNRVTGGGQIDLGNPPSDLGEDWVVLLKAKK